ncbi:DUF1015 domain-containing protein [Pendulispora albinea]|uniref:DUF1015 domain-containing protein n=1 Tax=Pendulispora albinea TaxID=2741071 RepID=A0ABZ2LKK2_9BACT
MADIAPLTPLRYDPSRLASGIAGVVAPPYDVISPEQREVLARRDPHNVVNLILPKGPGGTDGEEKYDHAAALLRRWREDKVLVRDEVPGFYRYDQTFVAPGSDKKQHRRGFLGLVKLVPFSERIVLPHERTLSGPKEDRLKLFRATRTNLSPGFMLYRDPRGELDGPLTGGKELFRFDTPDGVEHALTKVEDREALFTIVRKIAQSTLLIADGHHRYETALRYAQESGASGASENGWFMVFLANGDDPNLVVFPTHRHVHSLTSFDFSALLRNAGTTFDVAPLPSGTEARVITARLAEAGQRTPSVAVASAAGDAAILSLRADADLANHPTLGKLPEVLRRTDVALLHMGILEHVLGITREAQAAKTNLYYPQDASAALAELRGGKGQALFLMNATPVEAVRRVAEAGEVMPQKSTFFYPKVFTGLAIHTLEPDRTVHSIREA